MSERMRVKEGGRARAHIVQPDGASLCGWVQADSKWLPAGDSKDCAKCDAYFGVPLTEQLSITGATYRQLDYWSRTGYLHPNNVLAGSGVARTWPDGELEVARLMAQFVQAGLTVPAAAHAARHGGQLLVDGFRVEVAA